LKNLKLTLNQSNMISNHQKKKKNHFLIWMN